MTDSRLERIIDQLADFDEQELDFIVKRVSKEREERKQAKIKKLIENFKETWEELSEEGVDINYSDDGDEWSLDIDNFHFYP